MGFFGQRQQKGHVKAASQTIQRPVLQQVISHSRPHTSPTQNEIKDLEGPPKPPRPRRTAALYSFPPPPPLWNLAAQEQKTTGASGKALPGQSLVVEQAVPVMAGEYDWIQSNQDAVTAYDVVGDKLSEIISLIDEDAYFGSDRDLIISLPSPASSNGDATYTPATADSERTLVNFTIPQSRYQSKSTAYQQPFRTERTINFLSKVSFYSNSRLPKSLPPLRVYIPTWPLFCLAAQYSSTAYQKGPPSDWSDQASAFIPTNTAPGSKAMVIKSVPCDSKKTIVFAIRGTSVVSLRDWNTNLNTKPTSPADFLDDQGNLCHAGFLRVAKAMIMPIATRLRQLLEQNPSRSACSLLITGHSAGGAVASLLYAHMLSQTVTSDLTILTSCFKRVHCITFGAPPVTLLPLQKPANAEARLKKCLFHSFINEGDPVVRAEKSYIKSLVDLVTTQLPNPLKENSKTMGMISTGLSKLDLSILPSIGHVANESKQSLKKMTSRPALLSSHSSPAAVPNGQQQTLQGNAQYLPAEYKEHIPSSKPPRWVLPTATLSNAGRLVVLRITPLPESSQARFSPQIASPSLSATAILRNEFDTVRAEIVTEDELRSVVFGDPLMHSMEVYRRRVEALAMKAVTGRNTYQA